MADTLEFPCSGFFEQNFHLKFPCWVEHEDDHGDDEGGRHDEGRDIEGGAVNVGEDRDRPHHPEYRRQLKQMLLRQMISKNRVVC